MVASRMKQLREALGMSMPEFGKRLGCSRDVIANIEYERSEPKEVFINHVCEIYGVNREWLFSGEGKMFDETAGDEEVRVAAEIFRSLSPDLRELTLSQMKSFRKLMTKREAARALGASNDIDTVRLMAAMLDSQDFGEWQNRVGEPGKIENQILQLMEDKGLSPAQLAIASDLPEKELKKYLDKKGTWRREALIAVSVALSLDVEETQRLLTSTGLPALYAKNRRDAACIFALMKGLDIIQLKELLAGLEETTI